MPYVRAPSGHWGADCSLSWQRPPTARAPGRIALLAGQGYAPRAVGPRIYVYELPPNVTTWYNTQRIDRPLHLLLWQRIMSAGVRTTDGDAADYYFLPLNSRSTHFLADLARSLQYIRQHYPWWDRLGGSRHLLFHTGGAGQGRAGQRATCGPRRQ